MGSPSSQHPCLCDAWRPAALFALPDRRTSHTRQVTGVEKCVWARQVESCQAQRRRVVQDFCWQVHRLISIKQSGPLRYMAMCNDCISSPRCAACGTLDTAFHMTKANTNSSQQRKKLLVGSTCKEIGSTPQDTPCNSESKMWQEKGELDLTRISGIGTWKDALWQDSGALLAVHM